MQGQNYSGGKSNVARGIPGTRFPVDGGSDCGTNKEKHFSSTTGGKPGYVCCDFAAILSKKRQLKAYFKAVGGYACLLNFLPTNGMSLPILGHEKHNLVPNLLALKGAKTESRCQN
jgi:hypothetical protein